MSSASAPARVAYLLADTPIPDDPRVRRTGDLLHAAGWDVTGIGLGGWRSPAPPWRILHPASDEHGAAAAHPQAAGAAQPTLLAPAGSLARRSLEGAWRCAAWVGATALAPTVPLVTAFSNEAGEAFERRRKTLRDDAAWPKRQALRLYQWAQRARRAPHWVRLYAGTHDNLEDDFLYRAAPNLRALQDIATAQTRPGVWVANDWRLLPAAAAAADKVGGHLVYDSHEFATEEYAERLSWRLFQRPVAAAVERHWIRKASAVITVSPGITAALKRMYGLAAPTDTIRNTPIYAATPFRATTERIEVLYHGVVSPGRGLEASIRSMALARPEFRLSIRGPSGLPGYRESLDALIAETGVGDRVRLLPPVPMTALVEAASAFDIGLMALPGHSAHNRFALPNKIFEYLMAGLALCVSDLPAMAEVVKDTDAGVVIRDASPSAIAEALNALDRGRIDTMKRAALHAAKTLNWNVEGGRLMALLEHVHAGTA